MTKITTSEWLSTYLYYNEPWEIFLVEAVEPYIKMVIQTGIAEQYFFIRYWDRGPHIRLRFKGDPKIIETMLRPNIEEYFLGYFDSKPSQRTEPTYPDTLPDEYKWLPNNSMQFVPYEPEIDRYGGILPTQIAELQFQASSDVVLHHLKEIKNDWTYEDALGVAIKLHLSFAHATGMNQSQARQFFQFIYYNWLPRSFRFYHNKLSQEEYIAQAKESTAAFEKSFEIQKDTLLPYQEVLWEALNSGEKMEEETLNTWTSTNAYIKLQLDSAQMRNELFERPEEEQYSIANQSVLDPMKKLRWSIYGDYFHMTNNRLGIHNKDEGYLAYLMMECLKQMEQKENNYSSS